MRKRVNMMIGRFIFAQILPQMLGGIECRTPRQLGQEAHGCRHGAFVPQMPSGAVHQHHNTIVGKLCSHLGKKPGHHGAIDIREKSGGDMASLGADGGQDIEGFTDHLPGDNGAERCGRPPSSQGIHESTPSCIFGHDDDRTRLSSRTCFQLFLDEDGKVFFNGACAS